MPFLGVSGALLISVALCGCGNNDTGGKQQITGGPSDQEVSELSEDQHSQQKPVVPDPRRSSPESCYTAFRFAWMVGDYDEAFKLLTPNARREIVANVLGYIAMIEDVAHGSPENPYDFSNDGATPENKARAKHLSQVMQDRGHESASELFKKHMGSDLDKLSYDQLQERYRETLIKMTQELGPLEGFVRDTIGVVRGERPYVTNREALDVLRLRYGPLVEVIIDGETAQGWQHIGGYRSEEVSVEFVLDDSGWLIDHAIPEGHYLFQGGLSRDEEGAIQPR